MKISVLWRGLAWCVLALAFGMAVYRAKTQTIAHDEALEYEWFLDGGVAHVLQYNSGNHILYTLMAKPIVWMLGVTELSLRAPSLMGAAIYLMVSYFLCRRLFGEGILLLLSVAMLSLNPQVLDFMAAARGYLIGLAGLAVSMYTMARVLEREEFDPQDKELQWACAIASVALALSVAATLTNVIPATCLALAFSAVIMGGFRALFQSRDRKFRILATYLFAPGVAAGFCILWPYLIQVRPEHIYSSVKQGSEALRDVFTSNFLYKWTDDVYASPLGAVPSSPGSWQGRVTALGSYFLMPLLFCFVAAGVIHAWRAAPGSRTKQNGHCRVFGSSAILSVLLILMPHISSRATWPNSRYCLFLIPLFTVGGILAGREIYSRFPHSYLKAAGLLMAAFVVLDYALSLQVSQFRYQSYDVISRELFQVIANDAQRPSSTTVRVGGTWWYEPEINFYRRRYKANWMMEYDVKDKSYWWKTPNSLVPADYDYFVFTPEGDPGLRGPHVRTIFQDGVRGITVVAIEK